MHSNIECIDIDFRLHWNWFYLIEPTPAAALLVPPGYESYVAKIPLKSFIFYC